MNVLIMGRRGLGKSTLAEYVAQSLHETVLIFDANAQFKNADFSTSDLRKFENEINSSSRKEGLSVLAYIPSGDIEFEWDRFMSMLWGKNAVPEYGDYSLIIDEAHRLQKAQYINPWLDRLMRQAPRKERGDENSIDIIQTFHRPIDVHSVVAGLADTVYMFRQTRKSWLDWIAKEWDDDVAQKVATLRTPPEGRDVLKLNVESGEYEIVEDASSWYNDIRTKK